MEDSGGLPSDPEALQSVIDSGDEDIRELERKIEEQNAKEQKFKVHGLRWPCWSCCCSASLMAFVTIGSICMPF